LNLFIRKVITKGVKVPKIKFFFHYASRIKPQVEYNPNCDPFEGNLGQ